MIVLPAWLEFADQPITESRNPAFDMHARAMHALSTEQR
jgi:hypothetical protein